MDIRVGDTAVRTRTVTAEDIRAYATLTGDQNALHVAASGQSRFSAPVAHGMFLAGLVSAVVGTELPGSGSVYMGQELRFVRPVFSGDSVTVTCRVVSVDPETNRVRLKTVARNQAGELVLSGTALVLAP